MARGIIHYFQFHFPLTLTVYGEEEHSSEEEHSNYGAQGNSSISLC
jgi:hypothetical protein